MCWHVDGNYREQMLPGEILGGKYVVERVLGEGGMGTVVAARHRASNMPVAIKVLRPDATDETHTRRFLREVRGASQLHSDHVARVYDWGRHFDGRPFMVMELLDGPDLDTVLGAGVLPARTAASYIIQACHGLAAAHALGIVHRDIKPANLMLSRGPNGESIIKVVDFGIATASRNDRHDDDITAAHIVIGSITYMSPEQLRSAHDLDARSDIWSLGVTLYELLSGRVPFDAENFAGVAVSIATDDHEPLREAEPGLAAIVNRCLAKDPDDRFPDVDALAAALAPYAVARPAPQHFDHTIRMHVPLATTSDLWSGELWAGERVASETMIVSRDSALEWPPQPPRLDTVPARKKSPRRAYLAVAAAAAVILALGVVGAVGGNHDLHAANTTLASTIPVATTADPIDLSQLPQVSAVTQQITVEPIVEAPAPVAKAKKPTVAKRSYYKAKRPVARKAGVRMKPTCDRQDRRCGL